MTADPAHGSGRALDAGEHRHAHPHLPGAGLRAGDPEPLARMGGPAGHHHGGEVRHRRRHLHSHLLHRLDRRISRPQPRGSDRLREVHGSSGRQDPRHGGAHRLSGAGRAARLARAHHPCPRVHRLGHPHGGGEQGHGHRRQLVRQGQDGVPDHRHRAVPSQGLAHVHHGGRRLHQPHVRAVLGRHGHRARPDGHVHARLSRQRHAIC